MKRIVTSACVLAVGVAALEAANRYDVTRVETGKPWSVSVALRGFYESNPYNYANNGPIKPRDTFGINVRPSLKLNFPLDQTYIGVAYTYDMYYYERYDKVDQNHQAEVKLDHTFSERYKLSLRDSFAYSDQPLVLDPVVVGAPQRTDASAIRNNANASFSAMLTREFGLLLSYNNTFVDWDQKGLGSRSSLLDRMEHLVDVQGRYQFQETWVGLLGYQFGVFDYTSSDFMYIDNLGNGVKSDMRNSQSHYMYVGLDHEFSTQLTGQVRVGATYTTYPNATGADTWYPYAEATLKYAYLPNSTVELGFRHTINPTDLPTVGNELILNQESSALLLSVVHEITPALFANAQVQYQFSSVHTTGDSMALDEQLVMLGAGLEYRFNIHWSAETGYRFYTLASDAEKQGLAPRDFDDHYVYLGVRATY